MMRFLNDTLPLQCMAVNLAYSEDIYQEPHLLTWINLNPSMDK